MENMKQIGATEINNMSEDFNGDILSVVKLPNVENKYQSREKSWIDFNNRILDLAINNEVPIKNRLDFLSIAGSNLDEFIMVRYASLKRSVESDSFISINGQESEVLYSEINKEVRAMYKRFNDVYRNIKEELGGKYKTYFISPKQLNEKGIKHIGKFFSTKLYSCLTPIVFDESRPFQIIQSKGLNIGVLLQDSYGSKLVGTLQVPEMDERFVEIDSSMINTEAESIKSLGDISGRKWMLPIHSIILDNLKRLFIKKKILSSCVFRILRDADIYIESKNKFLVDSMNETLRARKFGEPVVMEITKCNKGLLKVLQKAHRITKSNIIESTYVGFNTINKFKLEGSDISFNSFTPQISEQLMADSDIFDAIDKKDIVLHHPYDSYDSVVDFIVQACNNPNVIAIKQTLYRVSKNSPIMKALIQAAKMGKHVTCLLEIKARFNEDENIHWAEQLERVGGHVIYGVDNLKTHCKMTLVVKKNKKHNLKTYCHIGTGNYNDVTSKIYTDISYLTSNKNICNDVTKLFNTLTGFSEPRMKHIISAPNQMRTELINLIDNEIKFAKEGKPASIKAKCNSINDKEIIDKLYDAARAGVKINLVVRGICCMQDTENITIQSIVGRFLEHSRIYYFENSKHNIYIASADLMTRNLDKRFEIMVPILNKSNAKKVLDILNTFINDKSCSCYNMVNGQYVPHTGKFIESSQYKFMEVANSMKFKNMNKIYIRAMK